MSITLREVQEDQIYNQAQDQIYEARDDQPKMSKDSPKDLTKDIGIYNISKYFNLLEMPNTKKATIIHHLVSYWTFFWIFFECSRLRSSSDSRSPRR
jgi:hypothetical protein